MKGGSLMKREIISILLILIISFSTVGGFADEMSLSDNAPEEKAVGLLRNMELLSGENIDYTAELSRGEFANYMIKLFNLPSSSEIVNIFKDVDEYNEFFSSVMTLYRLGIVYGNTDGNFYPEQIISVTDAVVMISRAMGYSLISKDSTYLISRASQMGITEGISLSGNLTMSTLVYLMYNALHSCPYVQNSFGDESSYITNIPLLEANFDIFYDEGQVTANCYSSLSGESGLSIGCVDIDETTYKCNDFDLTDYLGYEICYYYYKTDKNERRVVYAYASDNSDVIKVSSDNIEGLLTDRMFTYYENNKQVKKHIQGDVDVIYNGKAYPSYTADMFAPQSGEIWLIQDSGKVKTVIINSVQSYVVSGVNEDFASGIYTIYTKYPYASLKLPDDENNIIVKDSEGNSISVYDIAEGDVIDVTKSSDGELFNITVSKTMFEGELSEIGNSSGKTAFVVDGVSYKVLPSSLSDITARVQLGSKYTFYVNMYGEIIYTSNADESDINYGYIIDALYSQTLDGGLKLQILTKNNKIKEFVCSKKLTVDSSANVTQNDDALLNSLRGKIVIYKLDSKGLIKSIDNPEDFVDDVREIENKTGFHSNYSSQGSKVKYKTSTRSFSGAGALSLDTTVFFVSTDTSLVNEDMFYAKKANSLVNDGDYIVDLYSTDGTNAVSDVAVIYDYAEKDLTMESPIGIVSEITTRVSDDGDPVCNVRILTSKGEICYDVSDEITAEDIKQMNIRRGCLVRYALSTKAIIKNISLWVNPYLDFSSALNYSSNPSADYAAKTRLIYASVYSKANGVLRISPKDFSVPGQADALKVSDLENYQEISSKPIYVVDTKKEVIDIGSYEDIKDYVTSGTSASKVLIRSRYGDVLAIYVFN